MAIDKTKLTGVEKVYPLHVSPYEQYMGDFQNPSVVSKLNAMLQSLHQMGRLTNETVSQWNNVMKWIVDGGMDEIAETITNEKVTVALNEVMRMLDVSLNNGLKELAENVSDEKIDELLESGQFESMITESLVEINEVVEGKLKGFNLQLAETGVAVKTTEQRMNSEIIPRKNQKAVMIFQDDDGRTTFRSKWLGIIEEKNVPVTIGVITSFVGKATYMDWTDLKDLRDNFGVELVNHTHTHPRLGDITDAQLYDEFKKSTEILTREGCTPNIMIYPYGSQGTSVRKIGREFLRGAFDIRQTVNTPPLETFRINRVSLGEETNNTLAFYKSKIDECVEKKGLLVWMSHSQYESFDATQIQHIKDMIDYARSLGVEILNTSQALDIYGNIIDTGDYSGSQQLSEYTVMGVDGIIHSKSNSNDFQAVRSDGFTAISPLDVYPKKKMTSMVISTSNAAGFPENKGGSLETINAAVPDFSFQQYHPVNGTMVYKRYWIKSSNVWGEWEKLNSFTLDTPVDAYKTTDLPSAFPANRIAYTRISTTNPDIANFPDAVAGVLITNRLYTNGANYVNQEFHAYNGNLYRRAYITTKWGAWNLISTNQQFTTIMLPETVVPAGVQLDVSVAYAGVTINDLVTGSPKVGIPMGIVYNVMCKGNGQFSVRFYNITDEPITLAAKTWCFGVKTN